MAYIEFEESIKNDNWSMLELHSHKHYEIYFLEKGRRTLFLSNVLYELSGPSLVVIPPRTVHKTEGGAFSRHNVNVSPEYLNPYQKATLDAKSLKIIHLNERQSEILIQLLKSIYAVDKKQKYADLQLNALFAYGICLLDKLLPEKKQPKTLSQNALPPTMLRILDYLNSHYNDNVTLEFLSSKFFISKSTLIYNFKKYTDRSPIDFLLAIRLSKAKQMLVTTNKSVDLISSECGFSSANYFGLIFKKKEQLSPLAYRKLQREKT